MIVDVVFEPGDLGIQPINMQLNVCDHLFVATGFKCLDAISFLLSHVLEHLQAAITTEKR